MCVQAIHARENILISGGTSTGKTTLLNALAAFVPDDDRIVVIEDTAELRLDKPNLPRFEARREQSGAPGGDDPRACLHASLRHRPDRILVGEVRGGEAFDLLQALNTGHAGRSHHPRELGGAGAGAIFKLCVAVGRRLPYAAIRHQIADSLRWLLHIERDRGMRVISQLLRVKRYDVPSDRYHFDKVYERRSETRDD